MTDWKSQDSKKKIAGTNAKARQRDDKEDRTIAYRDWRRTFPQGSPFTTDLDQIEVRKINGELRPVAVLELTRTDGDGPVGQKYLDAITDRFFYRDGQGELAVGLANRLGTKAAIVLFRYNLKDFWVYNLSDREGWFYMTAPQYQRWISKLGLNDEEDS